MTTTVDVLRGTKEVLLRDGWIQGRFHTRPQCVVPTRTELPGGRCLVGGLGEAVAGRASYAGAMSTSEGRSALHALAEAVPADHSLRGRCPCGCDRYGDTYRLAEWFSEADGTKLGDVIALIDRAIENVARDGAPRADTPSSVAAEWLAALGDVTVELVGPPVTARAGDTVTFSVAATDATLVTA